MLSHHAEYFLKQAEKPMHKTVLTSCTTASHNANGWAQAKFLNSALQGEPKLNQFERVTLICEATKMQLADGYQVHNHIALTINHKNPTRPAAARSAPWFQLMEIIQNEQTNAYRRISTRRDACRSDEGQSYRGLRL